MDKMLSEQQLHDDVLMTYKVVNPEWVALMRRYHYQACAEGDVTAMVACQQVARVVGEVVTQPFSSLDDRWLAVDSLLRLRGDQSWIRVARAIVDDAKQRQVSVFDDEVSMSSDTERTIKVREVERTEGVSTDTAIKRVVADEEYDEAIEDAQTIEMGHIHDMNVAMDPQMIEIQEVERPYTFNDWAIDQQIAKSYGPLMSGSELV